MQQKSIFYFLLSWSWDSENDDIFQLEKSFSGVLVFCDVQKILKIYFD